MSLASALKRALMVTGAFGLALCCVVLLIPQIVPAETVRRAVVSELSQRVGAPVAARGSASISVFPQVEIRLEGIEIGGADHLVSAEAVTGALRLLSLAAGDVSVSEYALIKPRLTVRVAADGSSNWDGAIEAVRRQAREPLRGGFPDLRIVQGEARIIDARSGDRVDVTGVDLAISWPGPDRQANVSGRVELRDEPVEVAAILANPLAIIAGEPSPARIRLTGAPARMAFDGRIAGGGVNTAEGVMTVDTPSLRAFLRWAGHDPGVGPSLGPASLKGDVRASPQTVAFTRVNAELDGNLAEGALTVAFGGPRPHVQGTLDAQLIVAAPYFGGLTLATDAARGWSERPFDLTALTAADLDLRLSAREVSLGGARLGRTAASLVIRNGRLTATLGDSQAFGGSLRGALTVSAATEDADFRASLSVQRGRLAEGLGEFFGFRRLEGIGTLQLAVEAQGRNMAQVMRSMSGQASLAAVDGAVTGFNAEAILRRLERRPLSAAGADARAGRTPYERIAATVRIVNGVATTDDLVMDGQIIHVSLQGSAQLSMRELDLRGLATLKRSTGPEANFELPFIVQGTWDDPFILPDPQSLIRRSGAAAPLRDVTRDRDALRAVIDAISRHTGGGGAEPSPGPSFPQFPRLGPID